MIPNSLPEGCPTIPLRDQQRIIAMAQILEGQTKLPFKQLTTVLQHIYMLGYLQAGIENSAAVRQSIDDAITFMRPK